MNTNAAPILLTGSSGFLGAWILKRAVETQQTIVACDSSDDRRRFEQVMPQASGTESIVWQRLDVTDSTAVREAIAQHCPRAVIHLAALQIPQCTRDPRLGAEVNVIGHINVMEASRRHGHIPIVYGSSAAAKPRGPARAPANLYGVYKKAGEEIARLYWQDFGVPSLGLRPYIVYGVGRDQGETSALSAAMRAAAVGEAYHIPFRGRFCFQFAADVADTFLGAANQPIEAALLSDLSNRLESVEEVVAAIRDHVPTARITIAAQERTGPEHGFDVGTIDRLLGARPQTSLAAGVKSTIEAFRAVAKT